MAPCCSGDKIMSQQEFYETVQRQQEWEEHQMKTYFQEFLDDSAEVEYCDYCLTPRGHKASCCGETHFTEFQYIPDDEQKQIVQREYDKAFGGKP